MTMIEKRNTKNLKSLYKQTSTGAIQQWRVFTEGNVVTTVYGQVGGKQQTTFEEVKGKNIGKKNETSDVEQAELKAKQLWDKKIKEGYTVNKQEAKAGITNLAGVEPMLAQTFEDKPKYQKFPAFAQPKLDGHRCIAVIQNSKCTLYTRTQKEIKTLPHINKALENSMFGQMEIVLDGELYNHELKHDFSLLTSLIKGQHNEPHPEHEKMQYYIYDIVSDNSFEKRNDMLKNMYYDGLDENILKLVATSEISDEKDMRSLHDVFTALGYEGLMYRNGDMPYEHKRSNGLMKVKVFQDAEFEVVGVNEGKGKEAGYAVTYTVKNNGVPLTEDNETFKATIARLTGPDGKFSETKEAYAERCAYILKNPKKYIGQMLTVQYQGRTPYGIPRFPVALRLRTDV